MTRPSSSWRSPTSAKLEALGLQLVANTPAEFLDIVKTEMPMWGKVIKDAGIKPAP